MIRLFLASATSLSENVSFHNFNFSSLDHCHCFSQVFMGDIQEETGRQTVLEFPDLSLVTTWHISAKSMLLKKTK